MIGVLGSLRDRSLITNDEFIRLIYRFFGETVDAEALLSKAKKQMDVEQGKRPQGEDDVGTGVPNPDSFNPLKDDSVSNLTD